MSKPLNRPMFRRGGRAGGGIMTGVQRQGYDGEDGKQIVEKNDMEKVAGNMESFNKAFPQYPYAASDFLNKDILIGLAIVNPIYFICMMIGAMKTIEISLSVALGTILGPAFYFLSPEWCILFGGFIAGTIAFLFGEKNGK